MEPHFLLLSGKGLSDEGKARGRGGAPTIPSFCVRKSSVEVGSQGK